MDEKLVLIIQKSVELFIKYGLRSVSMDDISRELRMSKKTLYQYFENKADLLSKIIEFSNVKDHSEICSLEMENLNAIDRLFKVSKIVSANLSQYTTNIIFELEKYYPEVYEQFINSKRSHVHQSVIENLKLGISEGLYRDDLDIELIAMLYVEKLKVVQDVEFKKYMNYSPDKIFEVMFENHIRGIANAKGIDYLENQIKLLKSNNNHHEN